MKILAVDDEKLMLEKLCSCIKEASPTSKLISYQKSSEAMKYVESNPIDVAFLGKR